MYIRVRRRFVISSLLGGVIVSTWSEWPHWVKFRRTTEHGAVRFFIIYLGQDSNAYEVCVWRGKHSRTMDGAKGQWRQRLVSIQLCVIQSASRCGKQRWHSGLLAEGAGAGRLHVLLMWLCRQPPLYRCRVPPQLLSSHPAGKHPRPGYVLVTTSLDRFDSYLDEVPQNN